MIEGRDILEELDRLEGELMDTYALVGTIKDRFQKALVENADLKLENNRLRDRIDDLEKNQGEVNSQSISSMTKLYEDGFHICRPFYGKRLEDGESCILCMEMIY